MTMPHMLPGKRDSRVYIVISTENKELEHFDLKHIIKDIGVDVVGISTRQKHAISLKCGTIGISSFPTNQHVGLKKHCPEVSLMSCLEWSCLL